MGCSGDITEWGNFLSSIITPLHPSISRVVGSPLKNFNKGQGRYNDRDKGSNALVWEHLEYQTHSCNVSSLTQISLLFYSSLSPFFLPSLSPCPLPSFVILGIEFRASHMLRTYYSPDLHPQSLNVCYEHYETIRSTLSSCKGSWVSDSDWAFVF